jgi:hypothetical protein
VSAFYVGLFVKSPGSNMFTNLLYCPAISFFEWIVEPSGRLLLRTGYSPVSPSIRAEFFSGTRCCLLKAISATVCSGAPSQKTDIFTQPHLPVGGELLN